jgi:hypothetical protein
MWSVMRATRCARLLGLALAMSPAVAFGQAGTSALDPAFRLPAGGRAIAGPVVDALCSPPVAWLLSEDRSLYALTETGTLSARVELDAQGGTPGAFLAVDPFGRVVLALGGSRLAAYTKMGSVAWEARTEPVPGAAASFAPAFGPDGRAFALSGSSFACFSATGRNLWTLALPAAASCPPAVDGSGRPCLGLADGRLLIATPYGGEAALLSLGSPARCLAPIAFPGGGGSSPGLPCLAVGLADGRLLLLGEGGHSIAERRCRAVPVSLAWDGSVLYGLDSGGEAFALTASGKELWAAATGCRDGSLRVFPERVIALGQGKAVSLSRQGEVFREMSIPGAAGIPAISPAGLAFSSGSDWVLAAYPFERRLGDPSPAGVPDYPGLPDPAPRLLQFDPFAADSDRQLTRLADIEKSLQSGSIGEGEIDAAAYCAAVATRAFELGLTDLERRRHGNPLPRARACWLLASLGSPAYREPLFRVLESEDDPAVRAAACEALATLSVDPDGRSMAAFLAAAAKPVDERTALVIVAAIEGMALRSGQAPAEDGLRALIKLSTKPYGLSVRSRASAALGRISGTL